MYSWGILKNVGPHCNMDGQITVAAFLVEGPSRKFNLSVQKIRWVRQEVARRQIVFVF